MILHILVYSMLVLLHEHKLNRSKEKKSNLINFSLSKNAEIEFTVI